MNKVIRFLPLVIVIVLGIVLYRGLSLNPQAMPSALVGKSMPEFSLSALENGKRIISKSDLTADIYLVNVWATWCPSCRYEHPYFLTLAKDPRFTLYGLNYKDDRADALLWLKELGNPYQLSVFDNEGRLGLDLGVFAAPETFVIDHMGIIRKRFVGPINDQIWQQQFEPLIQQIRQEINAL